MNRTRSVSGNDSEACALRKPLWIKKFCDLGQPRYGPNVSPVSLPHGYTNESWVDGQTIHKHYLGANARARMRTELEAIEAMADIVATPRILAVNHDDAIVTFTRVDGRHGQELVDEGHAAKVPRAAGRTLRRLHGESAPDDDVFVHGDYGPQNLLYDPDSFQVLAVLDWQFSHRGRRVEDLAWAEWIVRMHHPAAVSELTALFDGYGDRPAWTDRHAVMISRCEGFRAAAEQASDGESQALWTERLAITTAWRE
jgi:aminoglycoside phosphotransferase (APT) family kinase protein